MQGALSIVCRFRTPGLSSGSNSWKEGRSVLFVIKKSKTIFWSFALAGILTRSTLAVELGVEGRGHGYLGDREGESRGAVVQTLEFGIGTSPFLLPLFREGLLSLDSAVKVPQTPRWSGGFQGFFMQEISGRRPLAFDLDRAFICYSSILCLGRLDPDQFWESSVSRDPWGLIPSRVPTQTRIDLTPGPVVQGWVGFHVRTPVVELAESLGLFLRASATPFFVPSRGISNPLDDPQFKGSYRWARRTPQQVEVNGVQVPLKARIASTTDELLRDVIFQPQGALGLAVLEGDSTRSSFWARTDLDVRLAPAPELDLVTQGSLKVDTSNNQAPVWASAEVKPKARHQWSARLTQEFGLGRIVNLMVVGLWEQRTLWSGEARIQWRVSEHFEAQSPWKVNLNLSAMDSPVLSQKSPDSYSSALLRTGISAETPDIGSVGQFQAELWGHSAFRTKGNWVHAALAWKPGRQNRWPIQWQVFGGLDLIEGEERNYLGEWRTNDRWLVGVRLYHAEWGS